MSIKQALKIETGERRSLWHKHASIAFLNYNTAYHASNGSEPSKKFLGRFPYNVLDLNVGIRFQKVPLQSHQSPKMSLNKLELISKMSAKMPCNLISNTKRIMMKKPMPQNSDKQITFTSYSQKRITKEAKLILQILGGLDIFF